MIKHCGLALFFLLLCSPVFAHKLAPSLLEIRQLAGAQLTVFWRTPVESAPLMSPVLPDHCQIIKQGAITVGALGQEQRLTMRCDGGEVPLQFSVAGLAQSRSVAMLRWRPLAGESQTFLLSAQAPSATIVPGSIRPQSQLQFLRWGAEHVLGGIDHLLFVAGLALLAVTARQRLWWITAFTLGHSASLIWVGASLVLASSALVEWLIALSIFYLAVSLRLDGATGIKGVGSRFIALVFAFGLLHGLGFAGALNSLNIPDTSRLGSLLAFNIGIEIGQLLFLLAMYLVYIAAKYTGRYFRHRSVNILFVLRGTTIYTMGTVSVYWLLDRGVTMLG